MDYSILGSILGYLNFGKLPLTSIRIIPIILLLLLLLICYYKYFYY